MKKKQIVTIIIMVLCVALLGVGYFITKNNKERKDSELQTKEEHEKELIDIFGADSSSVVRIDFTNSFGDNSIVLIDETWVNEADNTPLDSEKVDELLGPMSNVQAIRQIVADANEDELKEFGLYDPVVSVKVTLNDGSVYSARFGKETVTDTNSIYAVFNDDNDVYTVSTNYSDPFMAAMTSFTMIEDEVNAEVDKITSLTVYYDNETYFSAEYVGDKYGKDQYYTWDITYPYTGVRGDTDSINNQLSNYTSIEYEECVAYNCESLEDYGLENPVAGISFKYTDDNDVESVFTLNVGSGYNDNEGETHYYVTPEGSGNVYSMDGDDVEKMIGFEPSSLADKCIYSVLVDDLLGYDVEYSGKKYTVTKKEKKEKKDTIYYVNGIECDTNAVLTLYSAAYLLTISGEADDSLAISDAKPALTITYHEKNGIDVVVKYLEYGNQNFYQVDKDGIKYFLTDKRGIDDLIDRYEKFEKSI